MVSVPRQQKIYMCGTLTLPGLWQIDPVTSLPFLPNQTVEAFGSPAQAHPQYPEPPRNSPVRLVTFSSSSCGLIHRLEE
jgi:hypothetical protein